MAIESRFSGETEEVILNRMLESITNEVDKRQGSVAYDLTNPAAIEFANAYIALDQVLSYAFMTEDMPSDLLTLAANDLGVTRKESVKSEGIVTFTGTDGTLIPAGTQVRTDELVYFETDVDVTLVGGQFSAEVFAVEGGVSGNVDAYSINTMVGALAGIVEVTNPFDFSGGIDEESDADLLSRVQDKVRKPATSGNAFHYEKWAKDVPGVGDARVEPLWNGPGTVKVVLLGSDKKSPDQTIIEAAEDYIERERPIGATVTVVGAADVNIEVSADVQLVPGTDIATVVLSVKESLGVYLASIAFKENLVRYTKIASMLLDAEGVVDYDNLLVNGGTANVIIETDEVAIQGAVILNAL